MTEDVQKGIVRPGQRFARRQGGVVSASIGVAAVRRSHGIHITISKMYRRRCTARRGIGIMRLPILLWYSGLPVFRVMAWPSPPCGYSSSECIGARLVQGASTAAELGNLADAVSIRVYGVEAGSDHDVGFLGALGSPTQLSIVRIDTTSRMRFRVL